MAGPNTTSNMSLRGEPDSLVQTDLPAGPWPAGPTHVYNKRLAAVDLAAGKQSIFRRRFNRPGNYLIRLRQADFKPPLTTTTTNDPYTTYNYEMATANPADSPLPPPSPLRRCLPDFAACDISRCADADRLDHHARGEDIEPGELGECARCGGPEARAEMHRVPCGHLLCGPCLSLTAMNAVSLAHSGDPVVYRPIREAAHELERLRDLAPEEGGMPRLRASQERRIARCRRELLAHLGLSCCGEDMCLVEDWLPCLDEWVARSLWALTWIIFRGDGHYWALRCGWRDCGAAIPVWCSYLNEEEDEMRFHCVACKGNSMWHSRVLGPAR